MSFCAYCGTSLDPAAGPGGKCSACGRGTGAAGPARSPAAASVPGKALPPKTSRAKKDLIIALAVVVVLIAFWRLMTRPETLGPAGAMIRTNVFGSFGIRLAQSAGVGEGGGETVASATEASGEETNRAVHLPARDPGEVSGGLANTNAGVAAAAESDAAGTNSLFKVISDEADEASEPTTNSVDAAALAQRLGAVGAKGGDIEFSLSWNNLNDLDLHCVDPRGVEIWYENTNSAATGGLLDHDANAHDYVNNPVENIYWPSNGAPAGTYQVSVFYYAQHGGQDPTRFTLRTVVKGQTNYFTRLASFINNHEKMPICTILYDPTNPDPAKRGRLLNAGPTRSGFPASR